MKDEAWDYAAAGLTWWNPETGVLDEAGKREVWARLALGADFSKRELIKRANEGKSTPKLQLFRQANICFLVQTIWDEQPGKTNPEVGEDLQSLSRGMEGLEWITRTQDPNKFVANYMRPFGVTQKNRRGISPQWPPRMAQFIREARSATHPDPAHWVRIETARAKGPPQIGTGFVMGPRRVITAGQLVNSAQTTHVCLEGREPLSATVLWPRPPAADLSEAIAVLSVEEDLVPELDPWSWLSPLSFPMGAHWEAKTWKPKTRDGELVSAVVGTTPFPLKTNTSGLDIPSMVGAPILVWGRLAGVIGGKDQLGAIPVAGLLDDSKFRETLELDDQDKDLKEMRDKVAGVLEEHAPLKKMFGGTYIPPPEIADLLFQIGAGSLALMLYHAADLLAESSPVRQVMDWVLPWCVDWQDAAADIDRALTANNADPVTAKARTATLLEVLMARVENRPCWFRIAKTGKPPVGHAAIIQKEDFPIDLEGEALLKDVTSLLAPKCFDYEAGMDKESLDLLNRFIKEKQEFAKVGKQNAAPYLVLSSETSTSVIRESLPRLPVLRIVPNQDHHTNEYRCVALIMNISQESPNKGSEK